METFNVYRIGEKTPRASVKATDVRDALAKYAIEIGIDPTVRRDGAGIQYVGDGIVGRYRARGGVDLAAVADWQARFSQGQPIGMPVVLALAIEQAGGLE